MSKPSNPKIVPSLWYARDVEEAVAFYARVFPESRVERVTTLPADSPSGPAGAVKVVEFTLLGQAFQAMEAGPHHEFNDAISFTVRCESQQELDRYWNAILEHGGKPQECGWIIDRYGVRWQIVPAVLLSWLADRDRDKAKRTAEEMLKEVKLDFGKLAAAHQGH